LPELAGKCVMDVGCDMGAWSFMAADAGAKYVLGLDRNRVVNGVGHVDLVKQCRKYAVDTRRDVCVFEEINVGKQWHEFASEFGKFDVVFCLSMYHHIFENCGDHKPIWFWLWRHMAPGGMVLWENPTGVDDVVVRANVSQENQKRYTREEIFGAAAGYFKPEFIGPALHEPTREVWRLHPRPRGTLTTLALPQDGSGGASKAFNYADGRRIREIEATLGIRPIPGSLNAMTISFDWDRDYYRAQILDVADRASGLDSKWAPRWARFYPVTFDGIAAFAFRFEGETYLPNFVELIAARRLRDVYQHGFLTRC